MGKQREELEIVEEYVVNREAHLSALRILLGLPASQPHAQPSTVQPPRRLLPDLERSAGGRRDD